MEIIKDTFIELGSRAGELSKEFSLGFAKGLKIHLEVIVEIFNIVKGRYLTK